MLNIVVLYVDNSELCFMCVFREEKCFIRCQEFLMQNGGNKTGCDQLFVLLGESHKTCHEHIQDIF